MIKSVAVVYVILSGHKRITCIEYRYLGMIESYVSNPFESVKLRILKLTSGGRSIKDICLLLNRNYETYRSYVLTAINEYRRSGVLSSRIGEMVVCLAFYIDKLWLQRDLKVSTQESAETHKAWGRRIH